MLNIIKQISKYNFYNSNTKKYIVLHYVGAQGTAKNNADYFCSANRNASAHYFVDDENIIQVVEDFNGSWSVGNSLTEVSNFNSINIEMCCPNAQLLVSEKTEEKTVELVKYLMAKYDIPIENVRTHAEVTKYAKICPNWSANSWNRWNNFKTKLTSSSIVNTDKVSTNSLYRIRKSWSDSKTQKGAFSNLNNAINECKKYSEYKVFDANGNQVYPELNTTKLISRYDEIGTAKVICSKLNVRDNYDINNSRVVAEYTNNETFNYNEVYITNDYIFVSYISYTGAKRFVAVKDKKTGERFADCF